MGWAYVFWAGVIEILWVLGLKYSQHPLHWAGTAVLITASFYLIIKACEKLPAGTVYAVFTGMGATGITLVDFLVLKTPFHWAKPVLIGLILTGITGIRLTTAPGPEETAGPDAAEGRERGA